MTTTRSDVLEPLAAELYEVVGVSCPIVGQVVICVVGMILLAEVRWQERSFSVFSGGCRTENLGVDEMTEVEGCGKISRMR